MPTFLLLALACGPDAPAPAADRDDTAADAIPAWCPEAPPAPDLDTFTPGGHPPGGTATYFVPTADPDLVYVGALYGGLYRSGDGGGTWDHVGIRGPPHAFGQIALDPADPGRILYSAGILYLHDGDTTTALAVGDPLVHRVRGALWLADAVIVVDAEGWVYRADTPEGAFTVVADLPADSAPPPDQTAHTIDASYWTLGWDGTYVWAAHQGGALHRSADLGDTWETVLEGPVATHSLLVADGAVWVAAGERLYAAAGGGAFELRGEVAAEVVAGARGPDGDLVFTDGSRLYFVDDGVIVEVVAAPSPTVTGIGWLADGTILLGLAEGLLRSADRGQTWEDAAEGFWDDNLSVVAAHPICPGLLWAGTECQRGLYVSTDWGGSWTHDPVYMHYVMAVAVNPGRPEELWVTTDDMVYVSEDLGATWETRSPAAVHVHGLAIDPFDPDVVLVGTVGSGDYADGSGRVWRTADAGATWETTTGLPDFSGSVHAFAFSPEVEGLVLAATWLGGIFHDAAEDSGVGLYRSDDGGRSWARVLPDVDAVLEVVACGSRFFAATETGVHVSEDGGVTWAAGMPARMLGLDCDGAVVRARDEERVYASADGGASWDVLPGTVSSGGEPLGSAEDLDAGPGMLYATENGGGIHRLTIAGE